MTRIIEKIKKAISVLNCSHPRAIYIGKNKKSIKQFKCTSCGLKGNENMVSKNKYICKVKGD